MAITTPLTALTLLLALLATEGTTVPDLLESAVGVSDVSTISTTNSICQTEQVRQDHPVLCRMLTRLEDDAEGLAYEMTEWAHQHGLLVGERFRNNQATKSYVSSATTTTDGAAADASDQLPVVFAHGMGDSCFNDGMIHIAKHTSELLGGVYATCVPTGDTQAEDTSNGYFLNMDKSVDVFAAKIAADPKLQHGFHAVGFSQGNNVIRGYISRYNTPAVHTFLSINGVNAGEGTVPGCFPNNNNNELEEVEKNSQNDNFKLGGLCNLLLEQASNRAYTEFAQQHSFQANYWRDPRQKEVDAYHQFSQLARWNNEGPDNNNVTLKENWAKTQKFVWVMATEDGMVWPSLGEWWGAPNRDDPFNSPVIPMNQTEWYTQDLFGLKTAQEAGKNYFEEFQGDHLQFSMEDFEKWVQTYMAVKHEENDPASIQ